jgi:hypothetical protein
MKISTFLRVWVIYTTMYFQIKGYRLFELTLVNSIEWAILSSIVVALIIWRLPEGISETLLICTAVSMLLKFIGVGLLTQLGTVAVIVIIGIIMLVSAAIFLGEGVRRNDKRMTADCHH